MRVKWLLSAVLMTGCSPLVFSHNLTFNLERSFTIKAPLQYADNLRFADLNRDGMPEVLAQDSAYTVLYSISGDSNIAVIHKEDMTRWGMVFADVNRDSVADVVLSYLRTTENLQQSVVISLFDGARGFRLTASDTILTSKVSYYGPGVLGGVFTSGDIDRDGFGELVFSLDSTTEYNFGGWMKDYSEAGHTYCFHSFPDSLSWRSQFFLTKLDSAVAVNNQRVFFGEAYSFSVHTEFGPGVDFFKYTSTILGIQSDGTPLSVIGRGSAVNCHARDYTDSDINRVLCSGNIGGTGSGYLLTEYRRAVSGRDAGYPTCGVFADSIRLYRLLSDYTISHVSSRSGRAYADYFYHPLFPGSLLSSRGGKMYVFDGFSLSASDSTPSLPSGRLSWQYPMADSIPRLVAVNGTTLSYYTLEVALGVDDNDDTRSLPESVELYPNFPNPFNSSTVIFFDLPRSESVRLVIIDILGRETRTLTDTRYSAGLHHALWDGRDARGRLVGSGIYFYRLEVGSFSQSRKMILLK